MYQMRWDFVRRMALKTNWILDRSFITGEYFEDATRLLKTAGVEPVMLTTLLKQFFNTLQDEVAALGEMNVATLIVWGRHDTAVPLDRDREMHALLKDSEMEILGGVGRCPHNEASSRFDQRAIEFLT